MLPRAALTAATVRAQLAAGLSPRIGTRRTSDGVAIELHETGEEREPLRLGTRREMTLTRRRKPLAARAVLALWGELAAMTEAEVREADRRLARAGEDDDAIRRAIRGACQVRA